MQVEPRLTALTFNAFQHLKLKCDEPGSNVAFKNGFNLGPYGTVGLTRYAANRRRHVFGKAPSYTSPPLSYGLNLSRLCVPVTPIHVNTPGIPRYDMQVELRRGLKFS